MNDSKLNQTIKGAVGKSQITPDMLKNSLNVACDCGGIIFSEKLFFKKISAIISPSGKEEVAPIPIIVCEVCGKVPSIFDIRNILPSEIKAIKPEILSNNFNSTNKEQESNEHMNLT